MTGKTLYQAGLIIGALFVLAACGDGSWSQCNYSPPAGFQGTCCPGTSQEWDCYVDYSCVDGHWERGYDCSPCQCGAEVGPCFVEGEVQTTMQGICCLGMMTEAPCVEESTCVGGMWQPGPANCSLCSCPVDFALPLHPLELAASAGVSYGPTQRLVSTVPMGLGAGMSTGNGATLFSGSRVLPRSTSLGR